MQTYGHIPSNSLFDVKIVTDTDVFFLQLFMLSLRVVKSSNYFLERNHFFGSATENVEVDFYEDLERNVM